MVCLSVRLTQHRYGPEVAITLRFDNEEMADVVQKLQSLSALLLGKWHTSYEHAGLYVHLSNWFHRRELNEVQTGPMQMFWY